jgi:AraC family transcriptional regulator
MSERHTSRLLESPVIQVYDVCCTAPRSGYGSAELTRVPQIVLPRRGVFVVERQGKQRVVDTNTALVFGAADEYRVSHPAAGGDDCTVAVLPPHLLEDAVGGVDGRLGSLRSRDHLAVCLITRTLRNRRAAQLESEEAAMLLVEVLSRAFAVRARADGRDLRPAQHLRVEQVRALLASAPTVRWDLQTVARAVSCSPFHLARQFRAVTGETISRYLLRLSLSLAVERLADGERNLSALALETGFAHHSHFSARFRAVFGMTPTTARDMLTKRRLDRLRAFVDAPL